MPTTNHRFLKVATFNLCNYLAPPNAFYDFENIYSSEQWDKKQRWISRYLQEQQPDIIGFQEVFSPEALELLLKTEGYPYFCTVDAPEIIDDYIFQHPIVALASRYPIRSVDKVIVDPAVSNHMGLKDGFGYSRSPLRATVQLPDIGLCDCYVVHFKSKRPILDEDALAQDHEKNHPEKQLVEQFIAEMTGGWASSIQRGSEAAQLLSTMIKRKVETGYPAMLMGDFNDDIQTGVLGHLLTHSLRQLSEDENGRYIAPYRFKESWSLLQASLNSTTNTPSKPAPYTYYYGAKGQVLDYILLSSEFDTEYPESLAEVYDYHLYDRHLIDPRYELDSHSTDHAVVMISLKVRQ